MAYSRGARRVNLVPFSVVINMYQVLVRYLPDYPSFGSADAERMYREPLVSLLSEHRVGIEFFESFGAARVSTDDPETIVSIINKVLADERFAISSNGEFSADDLRMQ